MQNWRATRPVDTFVYDNLLEGRQPHGGRCHLEQMVFNVLDNARDASPHWVRLQAQCDADALRIVVTDRGPGFSAAVLRHIGTPYQSTKGRPGGGLGLFLSMNVARTPGRQRGGTQPPRRRRRSHHHAFAGCHHPARHRLGRPWTLTACC